MAPLSRATIMVAKEAVGPSQRLLSTTPNTLSICSRIIRIFEDTLDRAFTQKSRNPLVTQVTTNEMRELIIKERIKLIKECNKRLEEKEAKKNKDSEIVYVPPPSRFF